MEGGLCVLRDANSRWFVCKEMLMLNLHSHGRGSEAKDAAGYGESC